jgi:hypothetical protein
MAPLLAETANVASEPSVAYACRVSSGGRHRFLLVLPYGYGPDSRLGVHGLRIAGQVPNDEIAGSEQKLKPVPLSVPYPAVPRLAGAYRGLAARPGVFTTPGELKDLAARINRPGSYSRARFAGLAAHVKNDLKPGIDWDAAYSGPDGGVYQYAFSYEPQDGREAEIRGALKLPPGVKAPAGAAVVASRLALYASLVKAGAMLPPGAPEPAAPAALARRILLTWADHGFRNANGSFQTLASFARDGHNRPQSGLGLVLGPMPLSVPYPAGPGAGPAGGTWGPQRRRDAPAQCHACGDFRAHSPIGKRALRRGRLPLVGLLALHQSRD